MPPKKITRKELLKAPDEFLTFSERAVNYVQDHSKQFTTAVVIALAIVVAFVLARWYLSYSADQALNAYNRATAPLAAEKKPDPAVMEATAKALEAFITEHGGTAPARQALLDLGDIYFRLGQMDKASGTYQKFLDGLRPEETPLKPLVLDALAQIFENQGKLDQAQAKWKEVLNLPGETLKAEAYLGLGRVAQFLGQTEVAQKAYRDLVANYPNTVSAAVAKAKLTGM